MAVLENEHGGRLRRVGSRRIRSSGLHGVGGTRILDGRDVGFGARTAAVEDCGAALIVLVIIFGVTRTSLGIRHGDWDSIQAAEGGEKVVRPAMVGMMIAIVAGKTGEELHTRIGGKSHGAEGCDAGWSTVDGAAAESWRSDGGGDTVDLSLAGRRERWQEQQRENCDRSGNPAAHRIMILQETRHGAPLYQVRLRRIAPGCIADRRLFLHGNAIGMIPCERNWSRSHEWLTRTKEQAEGLKSCPSQRFSWKEFFCGLRETRAVPTGLGLFPTPTRDFRPGLSCSASSGLRCCSSISCFDLRIGWRRGGVLI